MVCDSRNKSWYRYHLWSSPVIYTCDHIISVINVILPHIFIIILSRNWLSKSRRLHILNEISFKRWLSSNTLTFLDVNYQLAAGLWYLSLSISLNLLFSSSLKYRLSGVPKKMFSTILKIYLSMVSTKNKHWLMSSLPGGPIWLNWVLHIWGRWHSDCRSWDFTVVQLRGQLLTDVLTFWLVFL